MGGGCKRQGVRRKKERGGKQRKQGERETKSRREEGKWG